MDLSRPTALADFFTPLWRRFGLFPFVRAKGQYVFSTWYFVIGPITAAASCVATAYYHFTEDYSNFPPTHYSNFTIALLSRVLLPLYSCYLICCKSPEFKCLLDGLEEVEKSIICNRHTCSRFDAKWRYISHIIYDCFCLTYELLVNTPRFHLIATFYVGRLVWTLSVLQLLDILHMFKDSFGTLEELVTTQCTVRQLHCLIQSYHRLSTLFSPFHDLFGISLLIAFSHLFVFAVALIYLNTVRQLFSSVNPEINVLSFLALPVFIVQLVSACSQTTNSAKEFNITIYEHMQEDKTNLIVSDDKLNLHLAMQREVEFTAFGFFKVDFTLIYSMVAAVTAYFIILVQFSSTPNSRSVIVSSNEGAYQALENIYHYSP